MPYSERDVFLDADVEVAEELARNAGKCWCSTTKLLGYVIRRRTLRCPNDQSVIKVSGHEFIWK